MKMFKTFRLGAPLLLLALGAACSSSSTGNGDAGTYPDGGVASTPKLQSTSPSNGATGVALNGNVTATFSEAMDPATLTPSTFTVSSGNTPVTGTVIATGATATFWPAAHLASNATYTASVSTGAKSAFGVALASSTTWTFVTGTTVAAGLPVALGGAGSFVILAKSGISTVPASVITGDLGVSPASSTAITNFSLSLDASGLFSTSSQVTGKIYAVDYAAPTPTNLTTAVNDMGLSFTDAAGRAPDVTELGAGSIGGQTLAPGVYKWSSGLLIPTDITLSGAATDVWIFQVAQNLTFSSAAKVVLSGAALAKNVFWQVSGAVELGTTAHIEGVVLSQTNIALKTGATANGRLLAQTAVTLDHATVVQPAP